MGIVRTARRASLAVIDWPRWRCQALPDGAKQEEGPCRLAPARKVNVSVRAQADKIRDVVRRLHGAQPHCTLEALQRTTRRV